ncbi:MAG: LytTR family DNA-binding domain-containing protein [Ferruginibacter sp.]
MIQTILVDDEPRGINTLKKILEANCPEIKIVATCCNAADAKENIEQLKPDLVLMDISMPGKNSLEMLAEMKTINFQIIFVTAHNEYSIQAFKYSAVDYLLKPVHEDDLMNAVDRAGKKIAEGAINKNIETLLYNIQQQHKQIDIKICIPSLKGFQVVLINEIIYCEAESSYTTFHLVNGQKITASKSILEYEELLNFNDFIRIHRFYLVNLHHVKGYQRGEGGIVTLSNGKELEVSRRKKDLFIGIMKDRFRF